MRAVVCRTTPDGALAGRRRLDGMGAAAWGQSKIKARSIRIIAAPWCAPARAEKEEEELVEEDYWVHTEEDL